MGYGGPATAGYLALTDCFVSAARGGPYRGRDGALCQRPDIFVHGRVHAGVGDAALGFAPTDRAAHRQRGRDEPGADDRRLHAGHRIFEHVGQQHRDHSGDASYRVERAGPRPRRPGGYAGWRGGGGSCGRAEYYRGRRLELRDLPHAFHRLRGEHRLARDAYRDAAEPVHGEFPRIRV